MNKIDKSIIKADFKLPEDNPYILPKGINWNKDLWNSITTYGVFQYKNRVYAIRKGQTKETNSGEKKTYYNFVLISNFSIKILQHMEDEKTPMKLVEIENTDFRKRTFETLSDNFTSLGTFKKMVEGWGNFNFEKANTTDYSKLKTMLMDKMGEGRMITILGWQQEQFWAFNDIIIDTNGKIYPLDEYGSLKFEEIQYYIPSANKIYANNPNKFINQKLVKYFDNQITFKAWSNQMCLVHGYHAQVGILFGIACIFSDIIFKNNGFFPMLFLYGEASTGKTKMIEAIQRLFGKPQSPIQITGKANTDKAKIRKFAQFNNMLVFLEEFNNTADLEMLKGLWNRYGYERGNIDSAFGTDSVPISSGVVLTGNEYPLNDALLTRLLVIEMQRTEFSAEEKKQFSILEDMMNEGYSSIIKEIIQHRAHFKNEFRATQKQVKKEVSLLFTDVNGMVDRMVENASVIIAVYEILKYKLHFPFDKGILKDTLKALITRQNNKRDSGGEVSKWWEIFALLFRSGEIHIDTDFKIEQNRIIIFFGTIHTLYTRKYFETFRTSGVAKSTLTDKLKKHVSFIETKSSAWIGKKKSSVIIFDINKIGDKTKDEIVSLWLERKCISENDLPIELKRLD